MHEKAPRFLGTVRILCGALSSQGETFIYPMYSLKIMTKVDQLAAMLKELTPRQLQQLMTRTTMVDGSKIKAKKIARTERYFSAAPKPHQCLTFGVYRDTVDYMAEIGTDAWIAQSALHRGKQ